jgi:CheY-like chemotaxis protein
MGISEVDQQIIFDDFVTLDGTYQRQVEGAGLGLSICRNIVEAMGGEIGVRSAIGKGSEFWFWLPLKESAPEAVSHARPQHDIWNRKIGPLDVLVVEDNETNRFVTGEMLRSFGCNATIARDGAEGALLARLQTFDLILMDLSMPQMNGWDAAQLIRSEVVSKSQRTPIYALTAHAFPEERESLAKFGMQGIVLKPLRAHLLGKLLEEVKKRSSPGVVAMAASDGHVSDVVTDLDKDVLDDLLQVLGADVLHAKLARFQAEATQSLVEIGTALDGGNIAEATHHAHKLAGAASLFGARKLNAYLIEIEAESAENANLEVMKRKLDASIAAFGKFQSELPKFAETAHV